jgi:hypothetical protein
MPSIFTTKKIGIQGEQKKKLKYYRNKRSFRGCVVNVNCGRQTCRLGAYNCRISNDYHAAPVPGAIQNKLSFSFFSLSLFLSFLLSCLVLLSRGVAAMDSSWVDGSGGGGGRLMEQT